MGGVPRSHPGVGAHLTRRRPPAGRGAPPTGDVGEFDFESSNARFSKEKLLEEVQPEEDAAAEAPVASTVYNKTSSFFDNLSCETLERQADREERRPRQSFQEQRKLDAETFGTANVRDGRSMRGGRGGGRGKYHSGGGGGGGHHPRDNRGVGDRDNNNPNNYGRGRDNRVFRPVSNNNNLQGGGGGGGNNSPTVPKDEQPKPEIAVR